jgi:predicted ATP-grasp superfamily ATP-dependent carboligase
MTEAMEIEAKAATEMLVELNEPEAWLEAMRRIADKRAKNLATGSMSDEMAAQRWKKLADALAQAQNFLETREASTSAQPGPEVAGV